MTIAERKEEWFDFVCQNKVYWTHGMNKRTLNKVKLKVFEDKDTMWDLLDRHGAKSTSPEEMKFQDKFMFDHCIGNFVCNIHYIMMDEKIIKG